MPRRSRNSRREKKKLSESAWILLAASQPVSERLSGKRLSGLRSARQSCGSCRARPGLGPSMAEVGAFVAP